MTCAVGQWRASADLPATPHAPAAARGLVRALLGAWELRDLADDASLVVSELVTNALVHAPGVDTFELEVVRRSRGVRLSLADGSAVAPLVREMQHESEGGRGMRIVEALASGWGADEHHGGKRVWVDLERQD